VLSDAAGLATFQPSAGAAQGAIVVEGISAAGSSVLPFSLQLLSPEPSAFLPIEGGSPENRDGVQPRPQAALSQ